MMRSAIVQDASKKLRWRAGIMNIFEMRQQKSRLFNIQNSVADKRRHVLNFALSTCSALSASGWLQYCERRQCWKNYKLHCTVKGGRNHHRHSQECIVRSLTVVWSMCDAERLAAGTTSLAYNAQHTSSLTTLSSSRQTQLVSTPPIPVRLHSLPPSFSLLDLL